MKDKFFYVTVLIFLLTLGITGFLYYRLSQITVPEYDNNFVETRNDVIAQIDQLSGSLNTAEDAETVDTQIQELKTKKAELQNIYNTAKQPSTNGSEIVTANQDFLTKTQEIIDIAEEYKNSFTDTTIDPIEKMNAYNTKVAELNTTIENIKQILEESSQGLFANLY